MPGGLTKLMSNYHLFEPGGEMSRALAREAPNAVDVQGLHAAMTDGGVSSTRHALQDRGFDFIGHGQWGATYRHGDEGLVAKNYWDPGYNAFVDTISRKGSVHFPLMAEPVKGRWGSRTVLQENLQPLGKEDMPVHNAIERYAYGQDTEATRALPQSLRDAVDILKDAKRRNPLLIWDLTSNNIMKRPDGTYVITDPFQHAGPRIAAGALPVALGGGVIGVNEGLKAARDYFDPGWEDK